MRFDIIPYRKVTLRTPLSLDEIQARLRESIFEGSVFRRNPFKKPPQPFRGELREDGFFITRIIRYRNNFLPLIRGEIRDDLDRRLIVMTMHPPIFSLVATGAIFLVIGAMLVFTVADVVINGGPFAGGGIGLAIIVGFSVLMVVLFSLEANKATSILSEIMDASEV